eukprot:GAHX01003031.1.p1 GENE.GAHX01003031.1~~GAHX01003031.1.p1  ORF type:complete len:373 (+),score=52.25 GAHX01003031.1:621-1739(+)
MKLKYYYVNFVCEFGNIRNNRDDDKSKEGTNKGTRKTFTSQAGCKFIIKIKYNNKKLEVQELHGHSNHANITLKKPKVSLEIKKDTEKLADEKVNLRRIMNIYTKEELKGRSYNDIYNIKRKAADYKINEKENNFICQKFLSIFEEISYLGEYKGIYFQDDSMKKQFNDYGDVLFFDATYNLFHESSALFILSIINGEGHTEPVLIFSTEDECFESVNAFLQRFILENNKDKPSICFTDKDWTERKTIRHVFPNCKLRLCVYHAQKTINSQINVLLFGNSKEEKEEQKGIIKRILFSKSDEDYNEELSKMAIPLYKYFMKNWNKYKPELIRNQYANRIDMYTRTNNRAEGINSLIKHHFKGKRKESIFSQNY